MQWLHYFLISTKLFKLRWIHLCRNQVITNKKKHIIIFSLLVYSLPHTIIFEVTNPKWQFNVFVHVLMFFFLVHVLPLCNCNAPRNWPGVVGDEVKSHTHSVKIAAKIYMDRFTSWCTMLRRREWGERVHWRGKEGVDWVVFRGGEWDALGIQSWGSNSKLTPCSDWKHGECGTNARKRSYMLPAKCSRVVKPGS